MIAGLHLERVGDQLDVVAGSHRLGHYVLGEGDDRDAPRPSWHPLRTPSGATVSEHRPDDHPWHWGLSLAIANISVEALGELVNLWGGPTYLPDRGYTQLDNLGRQLRRSWAQPAPAVVTEELDWLTARGRLFLHEQRRLEVHSAGADGWRLTLTSRWHNTTTGSLRFGSPTTAGRPAAGYGGFFLRAAPSLRHGTVLLDGVGLTAEAAMGRTGSVMSVRAEPAGPAVMMAAAADNPVTPTPWFVRTTPVAMLCAAPFFHVEWVLAAGATAQWQWSLTIAA